MIGIIGGMSWESTVTYYQEINRRYNAVRGGHHSAPVLIHSVDFGPIEEMQRSGDWAGTAEILAEAARGLERAGAGVLLLATNTMHLVFDTLVEATTVPWIHIADATGAALTRDHSKKVGLLGTRFTMEQDFYRKRLSEGYGLDVLTPPSEERRKIDRIIFEELVHGTIRDESRQFYLGVIDSLAASGAEATILGCTEIGLLVGADASPLPLYDTAVIHAERAVQWLINH
jgi:aspartate racemase